MGMTKTYEIIELDPATGEEDQLVCQGTAEEMYAEYERMMEEFLDSDDYEIYGERIPMWRVQPEAV